MDSMSNSNNSNWDSQQGSNVVWNSNGEYHSANSSTSGEFRVGQNPPQSGQYSGSYQTQQDPRYMSNYNNRYNRYYGTNSSSSNNSQSSQSAKEVETASWVLTMLTFVLFPSLGIPLLILKWCGVDVFKGIINMFKKDTRTQQAEVKKQEKKDELRAAALASTNSKNATGEEVNSRLKALNSLGRFAPLLIVLGTILLIGSATSIFEAVRMLLTYGGSYYFTDIFWGLITGAGGGLLTALGLRNFRRKTRCKRLFSMVGRGDSVEIGPMADALGANYETTIKDIQYMCDKGCFGEGAFVDKSRGILFMNREANDKYRANEKTVQQKKAEAEKRAAASEYEEILYQIHDANERIPDEEMSRKIDRIQDITAAIFKKVGEEPELKPQISTFMNYYLPTTLKLLNVYAQTVDQPETAGGNIKKARIQIEHITDTLTVGFEKQLDALYQTDAMDVAGEISVLENMLKRDGFSDDDELKIQMPSH